MYIVYKVNCVFKNQQIDTNEINIEIDNVFSKIMEARNYINNIEYVVINNDKCVINKVVSEKPTDKDDDGYYLVKNDIVENRVDIYKKKTTLLEGYIYNSYDIKITKMVFYEIKYVDKTVNTKQISEVCNNLQRRIDPKLNKLCVLPENLLAELKRKLDEKNKLNN
tara:strand:+ start:9945 stop:10442 length:498 start_codon:yes stop_codon:yes gene_type:complete